MPKNNKEVVLIGLGSMGTAMAAHLVKDGYTVHGFDTSKKTREAARKCSISVRARLRDCVTAISSPRLIFIMIPPKQLPELLVELRELVQPGDCIVDGGNSFFKESIIRHQELSDAGIAFIDCGISGSVESAKTGLSLMVGGDEEVVKQHEHVFIALAEKDGYGFVGGPGAGHFVKMVHNGIEYGMMGAISEGMNVLHEHKDGMHLNIREAIKAYEHGSIIEGNLMSWLADAYEEKEGIPHTPREVDEGETDIELEYLVNHNELRVLSAALTQRKLTRAEPSFIGTLIEALKEQFGGDSFIARNIRGATKGTHSKD